MVGPDLRQRQPGQRMVNVTLAGFHRHYGRAAGALTLSFVTASKGRGAVSFHNSVKARAGSFPNLERAAF